MWLSSTIPNGEREGSERPGPWDTAMSADHSESSDQNLGLQVGDLLTITDAVPVDITVLRKWRGVTCEPVLSQSSWTECG